MMASKKNKANWLVAVLCTIVIFQSVVIATQVCKQQQASLLASEAEKPPISLAFVPSQISLAKGEVANVDLVLTPYETLKLDGVDVVLTIDPRVLSVLKVTKHKNFSSITEKREIKENRVHLTFLEEKEDGFLLDKATVLVTLTVKAGEEGEGAINPAAVIIENRSSKKLEVTPGGLKINIK